MCRLFGFKSVVQSKVHSSLVDGDKSFMTLSEDHADGWGVAYYIASAPHIVKSESQAIKDHLFKRVSGIVASNTVVAHLRKATSGHVDITNTHPFQYGRWVFAHNGNIKNFSKLKSKICEAIDEDFSRFILGQTDSEVFFYLIMATLSNHLALHSSNLNTGVMVQSIKEAIDKIVSIVGPYAIDDGPPTETYLSFVLTNGDVFIAFQGGKPIYFSTYKSKCFEKAQCSFYNASCESKAAFGSQVNHLLVSSEPISGENIWTKMRPGELLVLDADMRYDVLQLSVV